MKAGDDYPSRASLIFMEVAFKQALFRRLCPSFLSFSSFSKDDGGGDGGHGIARLQKEVNFSGYS